MADITMCPGGECPRKDTCFRYTARPDSDGLQTYFTEPPCLDGACKYYWDNTRLSEGSKKYWEDWK